MSDLRGTCFNNLSLEAKYKQYKHGGHDNLWRGNNNGAIQCSIFNIRVP
jgi:hypothetical protein